MKACNISIYKEDRERGGKNKCVCACEREKRERERVCVKEGVREGVRGRECLCVREKPQHVG